MQALHGSVLVWPGADDYGAEARSAGVYGDRKVAVRHVGVAAHADLYRVVVSDRGDQSPLALPDEGRVLDEWSHLEHAIVEQIGDAPSRYIAVQGVVVLLNFEPFDRARDRGVHGVDLFPGLVSAPRQAPTD